MDETELLNIAPIGKSKTFKQAFGTDTLIEKFNKPLLNHIIKNWDTYKDKIVDVSDNGEASNYEPKTIIDNYLKKSGKNDYVSVKYKKSALSLKDGRWFAEKAQSIQNLPRCVRHTICKDIWIDLDFINCHPVILEHLCSYYKINCHYLSKYNSNRQSFLKEIIDKCGCSRDDAKKNVLKTLNGGNVNIDIEWWNDLKKEFKNIASSIATKEEFKKIYNHTKTTKDYNVEARTMNSILCIYENKCLESLFEYLTDNGIIKNYNCCLIFDGLQVLNNDYNKKRLSLDFLNDASIHIKNQVGIWLDISIKNFEEGFDIALEVNEIKSCKHSSINSERSDIIYAENILYKFNDKCYSIDKNLMMYDEDNGLWGFEETLHRKICLKYESILFPNIFEKDNRKTFDSIFNTAYKNVKALAPKIDNWIEDDTQIGYLLFKNGVLDMKNFQLLPFDPKYRFTRRIERDFDVNRDYIDGYKQIFNKLYDKQFTDNEKKMYFIEKLARGIAGEYKDREFVMGVGDTSCGKGVQTALLQNSFGSYIGNFNGEELLIKKQSNSDTAKDLSFIADIYDTRISISNELEIKVDGKGKYAKVMGVNCNRLKKLTGGGDKFMVRKLYVNPYEVINKSMPILLVNDVPEVDGADDAYIRRANYISYDRSSKLGITEDTDEYFVADETIKDFINDDYIVDSYVYLICRKYASSCSKKLNRPLSVVNVSKQMSGFNDSCEDYFRNNYKITDVDTIESWITHERNDKGIWLVNWNNVNDDFIECSKMYKKYLDDGYSGSNVLFGKKLRKMGIITSQKRIYGKVVSVYVGITDKTED